MKNFRKHNIIGIICLVSLAVCILFVGNIYSHTKQVPDALNETKAFAYYLLDITRDNKCVGVISTHERIQLGQIIFLEDDVYKVESIKLFCQKNENKLECGVDECHIYNAQHYEILVSFVGKARDYRPK